MSRDWISGSFISVGIDVVVFEVVPAFLVGLFGSVLFGCSAKCTLCAIVTIELYRMIRNLIDS